MLRIHPPFALRLSLPHPLMRKLFPLFFSSISINTGKSQWEKPKFKQCKLLQELPDKIVDLANITISDGKIVLYI